ncbi:MAG: PQQ-like beta-propeller repeat protein [Thermoanaerobaculia bacterium]|nr:PQQ-like beta-propeller repeat protein [Thermoanaerobaculia bacterium]
MHSRYGTRLHILGLLALAPLMTLTVLAEDAADVSSWLEWGGPQRNFMQEDAGLAETWPESGPKVLWTKELGGGYSSVLVEGDMVYTVEHRGEDDVVLALSAADGRTKWEAAYPSKPVEDQSIEFGKGPNSTALIAGDRLCSIGYNAHLHCFDKTTGKKVWMRDLVGEYGATRSHFGYSAALIAHEDLVLAVVGGEQAGMMGFALADGEPKWKSETFDVSYDSPQIIDILGEKQVVLMGATEVLGIALADGKIRWRRVHVNQYKTNCTGPFWNGKDLLFVTAQADAGSRTLRFSKKDGSIHVEDVNENKKFGMFHNTGLLVGDILYGASGNILSAYDIRQGEEIWKERGFPKTNLLAAGDKALSLDENGKLSLLTLSPEKVTVHASHSVLDKPAWTPPTLVGTTLYVRNKEKLVALELGASGS